MKPNEIDTENQDQKDKENQISAGNKVQSNNANNGGTEGTRENGPGDGGSSSQTNAFGSDGGGGLGSIAEGVEGAGGDSVKGAIAMGKDDE